MGQKANPIGNRLGIIRGWDSNWYGGRNYSDKLVEDEKIRKYLNARLAKGGVSKIVIERTLKLITVTINTARPGIVIGKGGQEVDKIKEELKKINYDVDDRAFIWSAKDIDKVVNTMTKENAYKMIFDFLPEPVGDKFAKLFEVKID